MWRRNWEVCLSSSQLPLFQHTVWDSIPCPCFYPSLLLLSFHWFSVPGFCLFEALGACNLFIMKRFEFHFFWERCHTNPGTVRDCVCVCVCLFVCGQTQSNFKSVTFFLLYAAGEVWSLTFTGLRFDGHKEFGRFIALCNHLSLLIFFFAKVTPMEMIGCLFLLKTHSSSESNLS